ncbi:CBS domain-containing protein [Candidatus Omnitrophota bacterium]
MNEQKVTIAEFKKILLKEIMVTKPFTIGIDESFSRVYDIFKLHRIRHLPVLDEARLLQGIITQRDLYKLISPRKTMDGNFVYDKAELDRFILQHVMTKEVSTLRPSDTVGQVIDLMTRKKYGCIPIVDQNRYLRGIITQIDVLRVLAGTFPKK